MRRSVPIFNFLYLVLCLLSVNALANSKSKASGNLFYSPVWGIYELLDMSPQHLKKVRIVIPSRDLPLERNQIVTLPQYFPGGGTEDTSVTHVPLDVVPFSMEDFTYHAWEPVYFYDPSNNWGVFRLIQRFPVEKLLEIMIIQPPKTSILASGMVLRIPDNVIVKSYPVNSIPDKYWGYYEHGPGKPMLSTHPLAHYRAACAKIFF